MTAQIWLSDYLVLAIETAHCIQQHQQVDGQLYRLNDDCKPTVVAQSEDRLCLFD
ncbi:MAG: hypothetical protein AAGC93_25845 [Cyanobacteria bacterium P01_F01_bin.53]